MARGEIRRPAIKQGEVSPVKSVQPVLIQNGSIRPPVSLAASSSLVWPCTHGCCERCDRTPKTNPELPIHEPYIFMMRLKREQKRSIWLNDISQSASTRPNWRRYLVVRALLSNLAPTHHVDHVGHANSRQSVRNDDRCALL